MSKREMFRATCSQKAGCPSKNAGWHFSCVAFLLVLFFSGHFLCIEALNNSKENVCPNFNAKAWRANPRMIKLVVKVTASEKVSLTNGVLKVELPPALDPNDQMKITTPLMKDIEINTVTAGDSSIVYVQGLHIPGGRSRMITIKVSIR